MDSVCSACTKCSKSGSSDSDLTVRFSGTTRGNVVAALTSKFVADAETVKNYIGEEVDGSGRAVPEERSKLKALIGKAWVPISVAVHVDYQRMHLGTDLTWGLAPPEKHTLLINSRQAVHRPLHGVPPPPEVQRGGV